MSEIDKKTIEYLAGLSRIEIEEGEKDGLVEDIKEILNYFDQLKEIDTENIMPMAGGSLITNSVRGDDENITIETKPEEIIAQFPEKSKGFLKIPPVFE